MRRPTEAVLGVAVVVLVLAGCDGDGGGDAPPTITSHPSDQTVIEGQTATFTVTATGSSLTYQWRRNGVDVTGGTGGTTATYTTPATVLADSGAQFACVVSNPGGSVTSNAATRTIGSASGSPAAAAERRRRSVSTSSVSAWLWLFLFPGRSAAPRLGGLCFIPAMGNVQQNISWTLTLPAGTYYWSVQAIDTGFMGGAWAATYFGYDDEKNRVRRLNARGYAGKLVQWVKEFAGWVLEIVKRTDDMKGFVVLPRRWVVERTFAWLGRYRRLSRDYEELPETSEAMILMAMINLMSRRLARE